MLTSTRPFEIENKVLLGEHISSFFRATPAQEHSRRAMSSEMEYFEADDEE